MTRSDRSAVLCASLHLSAHAEALLITGHLLSAIRSHLKSCSCQRFYTVWMSEQNSAYAEARLPAVHRAAQHVMMDSPLSTYLSSSFSFNTVQVLAGEWSSCRVLWKTGAIPPLFLYSKNRKWVHWFIERCANIQLNIIHQHSLTNKGLSLLELCLSAHVCFYYQCSKRIHMDHLKAQMHLSHHPIGLSSFLLNPRSYATISLGWWVSSSVIFFHSYVYTSLCI